MNLMYLVKKVLVLLQEVLMSWKFNLNWLTINVWRENVNILSRRCLRWEKAARYANWLLKSVELWTFHVWSMNDLGCFQRLQTSSQLVPSLSVPSCWSCRGRKKHLTTQFDSSEWKTLSQCRWARQLTAFDEGTHANDMLIFMLTFIHTWEQFHPVKTGQIQSDHTGVSP